MSNKSKRNVVPDRGRPETISGVAGGGNDLLVVISLMFALTLSLPMMFCRIPRYPCGYKLDSSDKSLKRISKGSR